MGIDDIKVINAVMIFNGNYTVRKLQINVWSRTNLVRNSEILFNYTLK